ncbi:MAG TPA: AFG1/ZapE family ATPase, partial [Bacillota bacterium]
MGAPIELRLDQIDTAADVHQLLRDFVPTPRFRNVSFATYRIDPRHPSQQAAVARVRAFVSELSTATRAGGSGFGAWAARLLGRRAEPRRTRGLYLDGGFGVGKTHLLAAAFHAAPVRKIYLSFAELTYAIGALGMESCLAAMSSYRLICLDEFELDDVANTRATALLFDRLFEGKTGPHVITTSN